MKTAIYSAVLAAVIGVAGCGGGGGGGGSVGGSRGYDGTTSAATVTDDNAQDLINTSAEGAKAAIDQAEVDNITRTPQQPSVTTTIENISKQLAGLSGAQTRSVAPRATSEPVPGDCGGSATVYVSDNSTETAGSMRVTYNNFCVAAAAPDGGNLIINGVVTLEYSETQYVLQYRNVEVTYGGETQTFSMTMTCTGEYLDECTYTSDFEGTDGRTYRIADVTVMGDNTTGYSVEARVYDPDHGYFDITGSSLTVCDNGNIGSGRVIVSDSTGPVMQLDYVSCTQVTVTRGGVSETINQ